MRIFEWFIFFVVGCGSYAFTDYALQSKHKKRIEEGRSLCQPVRDREIASLAYDKDELSCAIIYKGQYLTRFKLEN